MPSYPTWSWKAGDPAAEVGTRNWIKRRKFMKNRPVQLSELENLGPKSQAWLNEIGIFSLGDLEKIGPVEAYRQVKLRGHKASLNLVYAIQGAIIGTPWNHLPLDMRERLRREVKELNERAENERT